MSGTKWVQETDYFHGDEIERVVDAITKTLDELRCPILVGLAAMQTIITSIEKIHGISIQDVRVQPITKQ